MGDESKSDAFGARQTREQFLRRAGAAGTALAAGGAYAGLASRAAAARHERNARAKVGGEISVRYWGQGPERVAWQKRIDYFKSRYPKVKVKQQLLEKNGYEEFPALLTQIAGGNAPDVIRVLNFQPTQLVAQGKALMPLDEFIASDKSFDKSDFVTNVWNGGKVNGKQYAIPQNGEPYGLFYNADLFAKAGIADPWKQYNAGTWTENRFRDAAVAVQQKTGIKYGAAFEAWNYDVFVFMGGGSVIAPGGKKVSINSAQNRKTLQFLADMIHDGTSPSPDVGGGTYLQFFTNQQLGMYLSGAWWAKYMPKVPFKWQQAPLPTFSGHLGSKLEVDSLSISSATKNPEAAWAFVKTATDRKGEALWTAIATPTRKSVLKAPVFRSNPYVKPVELMIAHSSITPFTKAGSAVDTAAMSALGPMWLGKKSSAAALADAAAKIQKAIA
jgi:multiple sugar transport system substrate-binding protein